MRCFCDAYDADISFDSAEKRAQLERINLPQLTQEAAWLRNRLETEDHGQTRANEVGKHDQACG